MKKLNLSLFAILITISLMPQLALFSMEQPTTQSIVYLNANRRIVNGQPQRRYELVGYNDDGTKTVEVFWVNETSQQTPAWRQGYPGRPS